MSIEKVRRFIAHEGLLTPGQPVLVALSGGADSVALFRIMLELGHPVEAAHCNFHLRGDESDRDELFVRDLCRRWNVLVHVEHFDTIAIAAQRHISIEMAARDLRYEYFRRLLTERDLEVVAVAHHADDSVETILLNLIRGTGINGLLGIRPRKGHVVRPLLCLRRADILTYLQDLGQDYVVDSTNLADDYTRNKVRLRLMPLLQEINPSVGRSLLRMADNLSDVATVYNACLEEGARRVMDGERRIHIGRLLEEPVPEALLFSMLHPLGFNASQVSDLMQSLDGQSGRTFVAPQWQAVKDRDYILLSPVDGDPHPGRLKFTLQNITPDFQVPRDPSMACVDADRLRLPLTTRLWRLGDSFVPLGMHGRKKLSDFLTGLKLSLPEKHRQEVVCSGDDIVWVVGRRIDNRYRVTRVTKRVMLISQVDEPEAGQGEAEGQTCSVNPS